MTCKDVKSKSEQEDRNRCVSRTEYAVTQQTQRMTESNDEQAVKVLPILEDEFRHFSLTATPSLSSLCVDCSIKA